MAAYATVKFTLPVDKLEILRQYEEYLQGVSLSSSQFFQNRLTLFLTTLGPECVGEVIEVGQE